MANEDTASRSSRNRPLFSRLWRRGEPSPTPETDDGSRDIVDQAEAFKLLRVADVMTPRADVIAVELSTSFSDLLARFIEAEHSRMPIFRETLDDPIGVVHVKDVFKLVANDARRPGPDEQVLKKLKRELLAVPPSMPATALLAKMQATRAHMAIVIDEFGGADGLVTLEDLVEAVVGEIDDEHDETARSLVIAKPGDIYDCDGRASLEDLEAAIGESLTPEDLEEDIDTVGGLVGALAGRVPQRSEVIVHEAGYEFEILDADPRRVKRLRVRRLARTEPTDEASPAAGK